MPLRNLPQDAPAPLSSLVNARPGQVSSKSLVKDCELDMMAVACAAGESVSEERYFGDTLYLCTEGGMRVSWEGGSADLSCGDVFCVPSLREHAVEGSGGSSYKYLQLTV